MEADFIKEIQRRMNNIYGPFEQFNIEKYTAQLYGKTSSPIILRDAFRDSPRSSSPTTVAMLQNMQNLVEKSPMVPPVPLASNTLQSAPKVDNLPAPQLPKKAVVDITPVKKFDEQSDNEINPKTRQREIMPEKDSQKDKKKIENLTDAILAAFSLPPLLSPLCQQGLEIDGQGPRGSDGPNAAGKEAAKTMDELFANDLQLSENSSDEESDFEPVLPKAASPSFQQPKLPLRETVQAVSESPANSSEDRKVPKLKISLKNISPPGQVSSPKLSPSDNDRRRKREGPPHAENAAPPEKRKLETKYQEVKAKEPENTLNEVEAKLNGAEQRKSDSKLPKTNSVLISVKSDGVQKIVGKIDLSGLPVNFIQQLLKATAKNNGKRSDKDRKNDTLKDKENIISEESKSTKLKSSEKEKAIRVPEKSVNDQEQRKKLSEFREKEQVAIEKKQKERTEQSKKEVVREKRPEDKPRVETAVKEKDRIKEKEKDVKSSPSRDYSKERREKERATRRNVHADNKPSTSASEHPLESSRRRDDVRITKCMLEQNKLSAMILPSPQYGRNFLREAVAWKHEGDLKGRLGERIDQILCYMGSVAHYIFAISETKHNDAYHHILKSTTNFVRQVMHHVLKINEHYRGRFLNLLQRVEAILLWHVYGTGAETCSRNMRRLPAMEKSEEWSILNRTLMGQPPTNGTPPRLEDFKVPEGVPPESQFFISRALFELQKQQLKWGSYSTGSHEIWEMAKRTMTPQMEFMYKTLSRIIDEPLIVDMEPVHLGRFLLNAVEWLNFERNAELVAHGLVESDLSPCEFAKKHSIINRDRPLLEDNHD